MNDTIAALATPAAPAALAAIRVSGPRAREITDLLLRRPVSWLPQKAWHREIWDDEQKLDDVVLLYWRQPRSYTGEEMVEIFCHGNPLLVDRILTAYFSRGARAALPGEFTQRAFLHGKLDLTQAEAIADLIHAGSLRSLAAAQEAKEGLLGRKLAEARATLLELVAHAEAYLDFPEEDLSPEVGEDMLRRIDRLRSELLGLAGTAPTGRLLREGILVVLAGCPNVGKSSLFNAILRQNRAIVSPHPGTTRDTIESICQIHGYPVRLIDTAGHRTAEHPVEAEGVRRAEEALRSADLIVHVSVAPEPPASDPFLPPPLLPHQRLLRIANKADLGIHPERRSELCISTITGEGLSEVDRLLRREIEALAPDAAAGGAVNARQEASLRRATAALERASVAFRTGLACELWCLELRSALQAVGEVMGLVTSEEILDEVFRRFCIGK
ncbi:tRNA modification GTPase MnmE [Methylacidimicrobium cyclopophantes]|uniref:tRNA modification GTPase MnmE n=1 Tax=Methylacidimicrobium cyclopophantes TaxID=1041766 RepID=A0A5E6MHU0_9BACT|nr:tRNA uridine-5-carboxymethylaminomethyl(34) synthesis GTPase MnmE [Methylacidimicrobium cyclopophantes]VVM07798.1 tRNA modification GTPase MnmE [Methylacidimicrobium cyclopophantes]